MPFPPPGGLANLGIEPKFPALAGRFFTVELPGKLLEEAKKLHVLFHLEPSSSFLIVHIVNMGFPRASDVKNMPMMKEAWI